jgi:hypothetical protein
VFDAACNDAQSQSLRFGDCLFRLCTISQHSRDFEHFSQPPAISFLFVFNGEIHTQLQLELPASLIH